ncbi:MAG TPA: hypothetical protein VNF29_01900 [Candidatus Binataceae bacterium]|nr:hypothetical protein [Candidatus Binataceae bacterium]
MRTELMLGALNMTLGQRRPAGVIHHSHPVRQYTSIAFGQCCDQAEVRPLIGSVGGCFDTAMCESFFAARECEPLDRKNFKTQLETRMGGVRLHQGMVRSPSSPFPRYLYIHHLAQQRECARVRLSARHQGGHRP